MVCSPKKTSSISHSHSPPLEKSGGVNLSNGGDGCNSEHNDGDLHLWLVEPHTVGEGSPYAPQDWPNPGDIWGWRVGRRVSNTGFFSDRFLYPPRRLQKTTSVTYLSSKVSVDRFIREEFPGDENAFFASFSWKIPARTEAASKSKHSSVCPEFTSPNETKNVENEAEEEDSKTPRKRKLSTGRVLETYRRRTRQSLKAIFSTPRINDGSIIDLCSLNEAHVSMSSSKDLENSCCSETDQVSSPGTNVSPTAAMKLDLIIPQKSLGEETAKDIEEYLDSLDEILAPPDLETLPLGSTELNTPAKDEMEKCRKKLSSLLIMDFPTLLSSENLPHLAALASKIQEDPSLSVDQLIKLKLIEEIPLISKAFLEIRGTLEKCNKFFADLDANKARVSSLKEEYKDLKEKTSKLHDEIGSSASVLEDIDNQIAQLQSRREEITSIIETKKKANTELISAQKMVANSIPVIVCAIKEAYSERSEWEMKRVTSAQRESEVLEKFACLKGYSF